MPRKRPTPEEIVSKLRQLNVLAAQSKSIADAKRAIETTEVTYYRCRQEYPGGSNRPTSSMSCRNCSSFGVSRAIFAPIMDPTSSPRRFSSGLGTYERRSPTSSPRARGITAQLNPSTLIFALSFWTGRSSSRSQRLGSSWNAAVGTTKRFGRINSPAISGQLMAARPTPKPRPATPPAKAPKPIINGDSTQTSRWDRSIKTP